MRWPNWINIDQHEENWVSKSKSGPPDVVADISKTLPYPDNHADAACAVHVLEHFYQWDVHGILKEWLRVLKPGGKLILELPSMEKVFRYIANCMQQNIPLSVTFSTHPLWGDPKYHSVSMCHKWGYFYSDLRVELTKAGFTAIKADKPRYHFPERDMRVTAIKP